MHRKKILVVKIDLDSSAKFPDCTLSYTIPTHVLKFLRIVKESVQEILHYPL